MGVLLDDFRVRAADDPPSLLVVVLDVSSTSWSELTCRADSDAAQEAATALQSVTEQLLVFINTFLLLHESNRVWVILASPDGARIVYPDLPEPASLPGGQDFSAEDTTLDANASSVSFVVDAEAEVFKLRDAVSSGIKDAVRAQQGDCAGAPSPISTALATALCLHNRARRLKQDRSRLNLGNGGNSATTEVGSYDGRVLAILAGKDVPEQYVPMMNCIFSAQRMGVPLDSCILAEKDSTFFQQAAHLTSGVCLRPEGFSTKEPGSLIQTLLTIFLADRQSRMVMAMPVPEKIDFRASCMKTRKIIDNGYTCSVCLSTFATNVKKTGVCAVCEARFAFLDGPSQKKKR